MKAIVVESNRMVKVLPIAALITLALFLGVIGGLAYFGGAIMSNKVLTHDLSEPLNGVTAATVDINTGSGNLMIDRLTGGEPLLAGGTLQYLENQGLPSRTYTSMGTQANLKLHAGDGGQPWFRLPWDACNAATEWQIHLNPTVASNITAHSGGGNVKLDLTGMVITRVAADTGGGNVDVALPDHAANLSVTAKSGAGNVTVEIGNDLTGGNTITANSGAGVVSVRLPREVAARIHTTTGLGKAVIDSRFTRIDAKTYESSDYDGAANKVEITVSSGAGDVNVTAR